MRRVQYELTIETQPLYNGSLIPSRMAGFALKP
jgi:hypothetical protein